MAYADVEALLTGWIPDVLALQGIAVVGVFTPNPDGSLPANIVNSLPCVMVDRIGGTTTTVTLDEARVDIDTFAATRDDAHRLCDTIRAAVETRLPGVAAAGGSVVAAYTDVATHRLPYDSRAQVWRYSATYRLRVHALAGV